MGAFFGRFLTSLMLAAIISAGCLARLRGENGGSGSGKKKQAYSPYPMMGPLAIVLLLCGAITALIYGPERALDELLVMWFNVFVVVCVYYLVLALLLPRLREHISAWACAVLWLLPNMLYLVQINRVVQGKPLFVIEVSGGLAFALLGLWVGGYCLVMLWKCAEHLAIRRRILRDAAPAEDWEQAVYQEELKRVNFRGRKPLLLRSPAVQSPLSIGLFRRSTRIVLPERSYSEDELRLILIHEIVHICHDDASTKLSLVSTAAMCWLNPLVWFAMRRSAEDIELCCDEAVTFGADRDERRRYADLILGSAGDERGFTSCLSAKAVSLRYRLKNVMQPDMKGSGVLAIGIASFLLFMGFGQIALAYGGGAGAEVIFRGDDPALYVLEDAPETDVSGLNAYLASLELRELGRGYEYDPDEGNYLGIVYSGPRGQLFIGIHDEAIECLQPVSKGKARLEWYYVPGGVDWEQIESLFPAQSP